MANTILTPQEITREALRLLHEKCNFIGSINRQYDDRFAKVGAKIGDTLQIRLPNQFTVRTGMTRSSQDITERKVDLVMSNVMGIDFTLTSLDLTLKLDDFSKRILEPAMATLAANIEADILNNIYPFIFNVVGTPGTPPSFKTYLQAKEKLNKYLTPKDNNRYIRVPSEFSTEVVDALKGLFHEATEIEKQYTEGVMGRSAGFEWAENEHLPSHTNGSHNGTPLVNGAGQTGSELVTDGWMAGATIKKGTVFTIAGVYAVHPETKSSYGFLQQFTVTQDVTADGLGNAVLPISPSIITTGPLKNVSGSPADNAALTLVGDANQTYRQALAYHQDFCTFVTADLMLPKGVHFAAREVYDGIAMSIVGDFDVDSRDMKYRIDVLYGYKVLRPELACRIIG